MTPQREAVLRELRRRGYHPTADQLYARVRRRLPRISLGTVYRNLERLVASGLARKLRDGSASTRYDGTTVPHHHIRCEVCGRVDDVAVEVLKRPDRAVLDLTGYRLTGCDVVLRGVCPQCSQGAGRVPTTGERSKRR